jgi:hypothetical protein
MTQTKWTNNEITELIKLHNEEKGKSEISEILNKPLNVIKYKIKQLISEGKLKLLFKRCCICNIKMLPTEKLNKCKNCYEEQEPMVSGKLCIDIGTIC